MKTLMIKDDVYRGLAKIKGGRSFSTLLQELLEQSRHSKSYKLSQLRKFYGVLSDKDAARIEENIKALRSNFKVRT